MATYRIPVMLLVMRFLSFDVMDVKNFSFSSLPLEEVAGEETAVVNSLVGSLSMSFDVPLLPPSLRLAYLPTWVHCLA